MSNDTLSTTASDTLIGVSVVAAMALLSQLDFAQVVVDDNTLTKVKKQLETSQKHHDQINGQLVGQASFARANSVAMTGLEQRERRITKQMQQAHATIEQLTMEISQNRDRQSLIATQLEQGSAMAPAMSATRKTPIFVAIRNGVLAPVEKSHFTFTVSRTNHGTVQTAKPRDDVEKPDAQTALASGGAVQALLEKTTPQESYLALIVSPDDASVEAFYEAARALKPTGFQVGWLPNPDLSRTGELRFSSRGRSVPVAN